VRELFHLGINISCGNDERSAISNKGDIKLHRGLGPVSNLPESFYYQVDVDHVKC
jgi:hypothetical protein